MNRKLSITREQVDKLLEMCKDTFPEYVNIKFNTRYGNYEVWFDSLPEQSPDPQEYHWFELAVTELPRVMFEKMNNLAKQDSNPDSIDLFPSYQSGGEMLYVSYNEGKHVIDLLYKEHKKLKKWEEIISKQ